MTSTATRIAAFALSTVMALGVLAGMNGLATTQYATADTQAMAAYGQTHVAVQHVTVIGHRAA